MGDKTRSRDERASKDKGVNKDKGASKQRPTFSPTLPLGIAREGREASMNVDADMADESR
jgi:hypothetical protein